MSIFLVLIFICLCSIYSFGAFNIYFIKNSNEKSYECGEFTYTGKLLDGKFHADGVITLKNGATYTGSFENGDFRGTFTYSNGNNFLMKGIFENGNVLEGELTIDAGKILIKDKEINYINNEGWKYTGEINVTGQHGKGTFEYMDGSKYVGEFTYGLANKEGNYYSADNTPLYHGNLLNGMFDGCGSYNWSSTEYTGEFVNGLPEGKGIYKSKDGWTYDGNFKAGVFDGEGTITDASGDKLTGTWEEGQRVI